MTVAAGARRLGEASSIEVDEAEGRIVVVPLGATEQHGPHLPLDTDTVIATAVSAGLAARLPGCWLAPALAYGASGEHQDFPGTCSIGHEALRVVLVELVRSLSTWAAEVVLVNGHGGNAPTVAAVVEQMRGEGHRVSWVPCAVAGADPHAGRVETSLMLHLRREAVRVEHIEPGNTTALGELLPELRARGVAALSPNGVLGDPRGATAAEGERLLAEMVDRAAARLETAA